MSYLKLSKCSFTSDNYWLIFKIAVSKIYTKLVRLFIEFNISKDTIIILLFPQLVSKGNKDYDYCLKVSGKRYYILFPSILFFLTFRYKYIYNH